MRQSNSVLLNSIPAAPRQANTTARKLGSRWHRSVERYLPVQAENSIWRFSRDSTENEPEQGWKLHVSATVLNACDLFETIAPFLISEDVQFKAPASLDELARLNCGLFYGYRQVGKSVTIYPSDEKQAVWLARQLHELTRKFITPAVPFDRQYLPQSSVFYRYGAFRPLEMKDAAGRILPAIKNPVGNPIPDDRFRAFPEWLSDPFRLKNEIVGEESANTETPLTSTYLVFKALTQRGKGGTYQALDVSRQPPRLCVVKEGRRHGEVDWNGRDGYDLVKNESTVLDALGKLNAAVPQIFSSFEIDGNSYLAMEYVEGKSLHHLMKNRQRRFSVKQVLKFAVEIAAVLHEIHRAGWIWNDCKPANLIVTPFKTLRPIDFESSYPAHQSDPFDWRTEGFSRSADNRKSAGDSGIGSDLYALGAVVYFLLTGRFYEPSAPLLIRKFRRNVPPTLQEITAELLDGNASRKTLTGLKAGRIFEDILNAL